MAHAREMIFTFVHHSKSKQSTFVEYFISDFLIHTVMYTIMYHVNYRLYAFLPFCTIYLVCVFTIIML